MKKIIFLVVLCLSFVCAKDANDSQWRSFVGVEGGVGLYDLSLNAVITPNLRLYGLKPYAGQMNYLLNIIGGWQRYTYEKVGLRFSFGIRAYYIERFGEVSYDDPQKDKKNYHHLGDGGGFYGSINYDGLFDFVRNGDRHFGMILGIGFEQGFVLLNRPDKEKKSLGVVGNIPIRLGLQAQFGRSIIDFVVGLPLGGVSITGIIGEGFDVASYNSTLTLGYKHLF